MGDSFSLSIVMPAYNVGSYIGKAIDSVLSQSRLPDELIIINDGSSDNTRDVISRYENHSIVKVVDKNNDGLGPARNTGLDQAVSKYIYFFDSDDILDRRFVELMHDSACGNRMPDLIFFSGEPFCDEADCSVSLSLYDYGRKVSGSFETGLELYGALMKSKGSTASACLYISRRDLWVESGLRFKKILHEDEEVFFPLLWAAGRSLCVEDVLFYRRIRPGSIMLTRQSKENIAGLLCAIETMLDLKSKAVNLPGDFFVLWKVRLRALLRAYFRRLLSADIITPDASAVYAVLRFGGIKTGYYVINIYRKHFFVREAL